MNYSLSASVHAMTGVLMFGLSSFAQDARFDDLSVVQLGSHSVNAKNDVVFLRDDRIFAEQFIDLGPRGPGPFLPETDSENGWNIDGPAMMGGIVVLNPADTLMDPEHFEVGISNGFIRMSALDAVVHGLIDIEDYLSKGGSNLQTDVVLLADSMHRWSQYEKLVLVLPQDDPKIDPNSGLLLPPWHENGYLDQVKDLPTDEDRSDHPLDR